MRLVSLNPNPFPHQVDVGPFQCCNVPKPLARVQAQTNNALPFPGRCPRSIAGAEHPFQLVNYYWRSRLQLPVRSRPKLLSRGATQRPNNILGRRCRRLAGALSPAERNVSRADLPEPLGPITNSAGRLSLTKAVINTSQASWIARLRPKRTERHSLP